jgi:hypothetical protein
VDREIIRVLSRRAPTLAWHCSKCHEATVFECSELFRANSNGKLIDIWLLYRCRRCENTRNLTVVERTAVGRVPPAILEAAQTNDASMARRLARDVALIRRSGARLAEGDAIVLSQPAGPLLDRDVEVEVVLELPEPLLVKLDVLVAEVLAVPRSTLRRFLADGRISLQGAAKLNSLRLREGATLRVSPARRSVVVPSPSDGPAHRAENSQNQADDQDDNSDTPQNWDCEDKAKQQKYDANCDHCRSPLGIEMEKDSVPSLFFDVLGPARVGEGPTVGVGLSGADAARAAVAATAPGSPEDEGENHADAADDHEDQSDGLQVDGGNVNLHCEIQDRPDSDEKYAGADSHKSTFR